MTKPSGTRLGIRTRTAEDWEEAALDGIAARGLAAVTIPALAQTLDVTKGSFYWHFTGLPDLIDRAIKRWDALDREALEALHRIEDPVLRLRRLFEEAMSAKRAQSLYISLGVSPSPAIAAVLRKVSTRRIKLLAESYRETGMTETAANHQALLAYSAYIGGVHLRSNDARWLRGVDEVAAYVAHAAAALIASPRPRKR